VGIFARAATKAFDQGIGTLQVGAHILQVGGGKSVTGLSITTDKAMRYAAFWGAVRILSEDIAKLPLGVYKRLPTRANGKPGGSTAVDDHPVNRVIRYIANPQTNAFIAREVSMAHMLTWGNAYSMQVRDGMGRLRQTWTLATDRMDVDRLDVATIGHQFDPDGRPVTFEFAPGDLRYRYTRTNGSTVDLRQSQVFHVPGLSWDGIKGYSVIKQARETIGLGLAAEEHGARFFGNGATSSFVLGTDNKLSETAHTNLDKQIKSDRAGLSNAWSPWVLEEGLKPLAISIPHDDAQWLETRKHQVTDIARWFRLQPHKLADLERATFSNIEHQNLEYVNEALMGWITRIEAAIGMQLLGPEWIGAGGDLYAKFNVNALLRGDFQTRMQGYAVGRMWGMYTPNDLLGFEDMNPIPPEEGGDEYLRPLNMTTLNADGSITQTRMTSAGSGGTNPDPAADPAAAGATA
jgi:HK97 family phage portal protein